MRMRDYNAGGPPSVGWLMIVIAAALLMLGSGCARGPLESDALHCSPEFQGAMSQLVDAAIEAPDDVALATDKVVSMHDRICG